jgi:mannan endo-1,4-beta-mannosidase
VRKIFTILPLLLFCNFLLKAVPTIYEAETGTLTGVNVSTAVGGYTGTGYVTNFDAGGDNLNINITVGSAGVYKLYVRYRSPFGDKTQDIYVNGVFFSNAVFTNTSSFVQIQTGTVVLNAGSNVIGIRNNWGYVDIDNIGIDVNPPNVYNIVSNPINPNTNVKTKALYNLLRNQFTHCIFSGQTDTYWNNLVAVSGKAPAVRGFDMQNYSPQNPWGNGGTAWLGWDDGNVQNAIDWYNATGGIVEFHWHWFSPSGGSLQTSTFYTASTGFDVSRAIVPANQEYTDAIRDIDAIAVQLKRLETAGVPVLWRPLHEAGGGWFWWGAKGPAACLAFYDIIYNRLTTYHNINNLIWVWSTPEPTWYPGNSKVDILGYDSYPGAYNYTTQKSMFDQLYGIVGGQKLIALTENGPIPDIANCFSQDAPWSYFMSWDNLVTAQNTNPHIVTSYNQTCNLADIATLPVTFINFQVEKQNGSVLLEWQTASEKNNDRFEIERSSDGKHFYSFSEIKSAGNSTQIQSYQQIDKDPLSGISYYRLKQVDADGNYSYSNVVSITADNLSISVYPNPSNGLYRLNGSIKIGVDIKVYNNIGVVILNRKIEEIKLSEYDIDLRKFPPGIYLLEVFSKGEKITHQLIKE